MQTRPPSSNKQFSAFCTGRAVYYCALVVINWAISLISSNSRLDAATPSQLQAEADGVIQSFLRLEPGLPNLERVPVASDDKPLSIYRAVEITLSNNTQLQTQRESIKELALEVQTTRHDFQPRWRAGFSAYSAESTLWYNQGRNSTSLFNASQTVGISQRLPFGGEINLDGGAALNSRSDQETNYSPSAAISLRLPLMRGFGVDLNTESLSQRKRNVLYALRSLKLQQEELVLRTIENFLDLLSCRERIRAQEKRKEAADLLYRRTATYYGLGQSSELALVQADQQNLRAERDLKSVQTDYANRLDDFKVLLNLPVHSALELEAYVPPEIPLPSDAGPVIKAALSKRVDLMTISDVMDDKKRQLRIADKAFRPDLNLVGRAATASSAGSNLSALSQDYSAGIVFSLPLDRDPENLNLLRAYQDLQQIQRSQRVASEAIESGVRSGLRVLQNVATALQAEARIISAAERRLRLAEIQFDAGLNSNREVVDAQNDLLSEQNYRLDLLQKRFVGLLRLRSAAGEFNVDHALPLGPSL